MTREDAIINLKLSQNRIGGIKKEEWNALQMAIEALSQPIVVKHFDIQSGHIYCSPEIAENVKVVVRCKDCKHYIVEGITTQYGWCHEYKHSVNEDDYCSYGERKKIMTREEAITTLGNFKRYISGGGVTDLKANEAIDMAIEALSTDAEPKMTEEVREALMRLTMCAREECGMCKYKDKCGFEFQYNISTENMNTILEALSADAVQGEWIDIDNYYRLATCSRCHKVTMFEKWGEYTKPYDFCPNCGARMKGGEEE